jgi:kynurenine formamidase
MRVVDLSGEIYDGQKCHFPVTIEDYVRYEDTVERFEPPCRGFAAKALRMCDHTATHVDAPSHFFAEGKNIDEMGVEAFCGDAVVADFSDESREGGELGVGAFESNLARRGLALREGDVVLFHLSGAAGPVYAGLSKALSEHLVARQVKLVGTDQGSIDWGGNKGRPAHMVLLGAGVPVIEGLVNLRSVSAGRFYFLGLPLKLRGGTGSPVRAVALVE